MALIFSSRLLSKANLICRPQHVIALRAAFHRSSCLSQGEFKQSDVLAKERYDSRSDEPIEKKRARLLYQSKKRGMLENGVILASFADKYLNTLSPEQLDQYDRLINLPTNDWDIFYWATRTKPTPAEYETPVMDKLRAHLKSNLSIESQSEASTSGAEKRKEKTYAQDVVMPSMQPHHEPHALMWKAERYLSLALLGVLPVAAAFPGPIMDNAVALSLVVHVHWGIEAITIDYVRPSIFGPTIPKVAIGLVYVLSSLALGGLFVFNYTDIGITQATRMLAKI